MNEAHWERRFAAKICDLPTAVKEIPPGRRILIGSGAAEPSQLVDAMVEHGTHLRDNEVVHLLTFGPAPYVAEGMEKRFRHTAFFIGPNVRKAVHEGRADFMPVFLSEIPELIRSRRSKIDVAMVQVSPPDAHGYVSLGVSVDIVRAAVDTADIILAEVNPSMPRTLGDSFLHVDRITKLVPVDYPLPVLSVDELDEVSKTIGQHVASLIPDGATLQTGIGKIPNATLAALTDRNDLGVHTEMFSDGVMDLVELGVINGRKKTLLPGKIVTSFLLGTQKLYDWTHDNPAVTMRSSAFTNDPFTIARNDRMMAINSALAVDLSGQVAADTLMGRFFSGIGGQVDFIRGAARSRGGKAVIALPATAKDGKVSRIQASFEAGAGVVTSRGDVQYVVTEYGIADLWGKNIRQRAMALIEIAHPDFRGELLDGAKQRRYVFPDQVVPRGRVPWEETTQEKLRSGEAVTVRPVRLSDEEILQDLFYELSNESTYKRFMAHKKAHPHEEMQRLVDVDYDQSMAMVICRSEGADEQIIAMARYDVDPATHLADIAFVVRDEWQGKSVGSLLMRRMIEIAREQGVHGFTAEVLVSNKAMITVFQKAELNVKMYRDGDSYTLRATFDASTARGRSSLGED